MSVILMNNEIVLEVKNIKKQYKTYHSRFGEDIPLAALRRKYVIKKALRGVSFNVKRGEIVALLGQNGSGKSTMIKLLTGILHPDSGDAKVLGFVPWKQRMQLAERIGVVLGAHNQLWWNLPAIDTFNYMRHLYQVPEKEFNERLDYFVDVLDLKDVYRRQVRQLSLGERMKCNFVASILHMPELVFLDEPTIGVDLPSSFALRDALLELRKKHKTTFLIATHIIDDVKILSERAVILDQGKVVYDGPKSKIGRMFGNTKQVEIYFNSMNGMKPEQFGTVLEKKHLFVRMEIPNREITNKAFTKMLSSENVLDYNIAEPDFSYVLHKFYAKVRRERRGVK